MQTQERTMIQRLGRQVGLVGLAEETDRHLLERYVNFDDDGAFEELVRRHTRLVMGVCRRVLRQEQDAEDAFQAVFLVLAKKANSRGWLDSIGPWLHQTATRIALGLRTRRMRAEAKRRALQPPPEAAPTPEPPEKNLSEMLDAELQHLPETYRVPMLLCYLQGKSQEEAADELGWTLGALRGRLFRGRGMLRNRLARQGVAVPLAGLTAAIVQAAAQGATGGPVAKTTVQAALTYAAGQSVADVVSPLTLSLTEEVMRAMLLNKLKSAVGMVCLAVAAVVGVWLCAASAETQQTPADNKAPQVAARPEEEGKFRRPIGVTGRVKSITNGKARSVITIQLEENEKVFLAFDLAQDVKVAVSGQPATLAAVKEKMCVTLLMGADHRTVIGIEGRGKRVEGEVAKIDVAASTITLRDDDDDDAKEQVLKIGTDVPVYIDDYRGKLADLADCKTLALEMAADGATIARVRARWAREEFLRGQIKSVDVDKTEVTIRSEEDDAPKEVVLKVKPECKLFVNGQSAKLADLKPGWDVVVNEKGKLALGMRVTKRNAPVDDDD